MAVVLAENLAAFSSSMFEKAMRGFSGFGSPETSIDEMVRIIFSFMNVSP